MHAEVISIGDELTSGQRLDTNSQWLSERLGEIGVRVMYHTTVADDLAANTLVFRQAAERADVVVASGGLGPTADDLTREAVAAAAGVELLLDEEQLAHVKALFARRLRREMPQRNVVQAMFPQGSRPIPNPHGTAPGIDITLPRPSGGGSCRVFCLPGVPAELKEMWPSVESALLAAGAGRGVIRHRRIKCFGVGESDLEAMLPDIIRRGREPQVGITVSGATITLRITAAGQTPQACLQAMAPTVQTIHDCLGTLVYGEEDDELEHAVLRLLQARGQTLAVVELGTGGLLASWLRSVDEPGDWFRGGIVCSRDREAAAILKSEGVQSASAEMSEVVAGLARRGRELFATDLALAVGPFPLVDPQSPSPGRLWFAIAASDKVEPHSTAFTGHPEILKTRAAKQALDRLRLCLLRD